MMEPEPRPKFQWLHLSNVTSSAIGSPFRNTDHSNPEQPGLHYVAFKVQTSFKSSGLYHCSKLCVCSVWGSWK